MSKWYHMIVERWWTGERKEYISKTQGATPPGWQLVGVCGYHEDPKKEEKSNGNETHSDN